MSVTTFYSPDSNISIVEKEHLGELNKILNRLPQDQLIVSLFKSAQENGYITEESRLECPLVFLDYSDLPTLHWREVDKKDLKKPPVRWQYSPEGDLYISIAIYKNWESKKPLNQGFYYNVNRPYYKGVEGVMNTGSSSANEPGLNLIGGDDGKPLKKIAKEIAKDVDTLFRRKEVFVVLPGAFSPYTKLPRINYAKYTL